MKIAASALQLVGLGIFFACIALRDPIIAAGLAGAFVAGIGVLWERR